MSGAPEDPRTDVGGTAYGVRHEAGGTTAAGGTAAAGGADPTLDARARGLAGEGGARSLRLVGAAALWLRGGARPALMVLARADEPLLGRFRGTVSDAGDGLRLLEGPTSPENAAALRDAVPGLRPVPLGLSTSAGFGDRLGLATPGHALALERAGVTGKVAPVFAQQSVREMKRTRRSPQEVMDDATWGAFAAGWRLPLGADADHQKTEDDVRSCLAAGFTLFTIDPGEHVDDAAERATPSELRAKVEALPWADLEDDWEGLRRRFLSRPLDLGDEALAFTEEELARAAAKYGGAVAHAVRLHRVLAASGRPYEVEVSVDETAHPTTLQEHAYVAAELARLGVRVVSLAPRFVGRFEKGVDFRPDETGDLRELERTLRGHARVARALGPYKLSLHSGSDKFSVYPLIAEATGGLVHLKTAGTSYLEGLRVAAAHAPALFQRVLEVAHERFEADRESYLIGARLEAVPRPEALTDAELPRLLDDDDARQVLHVTYGSALDAVGEELKALLRERAAEHEEALARHFVRHLGPFAPHAALRPG